MVGPALVTGIVAALRMVAEAAAVVTLAIGYPLG